MLTVENLSVDMANTPILKRVNFNLENAGTYGLVGRNGAGKTTLLRSIMGLTPSKSGTLRLDGTDLTQMPAHTRLSSGFGYMPEDRRLIPGLSVEDNIVLPLMARGKRDAHRLEWVYSAIPEAAELRKRAPTLLSGGQQKLVALARAIMAGTHVLLLDEPTEGVAPILQQRIRTILREMSHSGAIILVAESNAKYLRKLADRIFFIERGELSISGVTSSAFLDQPL
jgi:branched-chain amino acid transport system ATP-binding protein